jgi:hypothetical protein
MSDTALYKMEGTVALRCVAFPTTDVEVAGAALCWQLQAMKDLIINNRLQQILGHHSRRNYVIIKKGKKRIGKEAHGREDL